MEFNKNVERFPDWLKCSVCNTWFQSEYQSISERERKALGQLDPDFICVNCRTVDGRAFDNLMAMERMPKLACNFGGPRKEFFRLIQLELKEKYFDNGLRDLLAADYKTVGIILALTILQNGKLPTFLSPEVVEEIFKTEEPQSLAVKKLREGFNVLGMYDVKPPEYVEPWNSTAIDLVATKNMRVAVSKVKPPEYVEPWNSTAIDLVATKNMRVGVSKVKPPEYVEPWNSTAIEMPDLVATKNMRVAVSKADVVKQRRLLRTKRSKESSSTSGTTDTSSERPRKPRKNSFLAPVTKKSMESSGTSGTTDTSSECSSERPRKPKKNCCSVIFGVFYNIYRSDPSQYRTLKMLLGYPFGGLLGLGLYYSLIKPMELAEETRHLLGGMLMLGLAIGYSSFVSARCVSLLLIPTLFGKAGRSYIGTFAIAFLIAGPMMNMMDNAQDITRSLTCAATLAANHTAAKWQLRLKPIANLMSDMKHDGFMLNKIGKKVNKVFIPVKTEVRSDDNIDEMKAKYDNTNISKKDRKKEKKKKRVQSSPAGVEHKYKKKIKERCKDIYDKGLGKCRNTFDDLYHKCMKKLPLVVDKILCPICKQHWLCEIASLLGKAVGIECEPEKFLPAGFGQAYVDSEKSLEQMDSNMEIGLRYKVIKQKEDIDYTNVEMMRKNAMQDFKQGRKFMEFFMMIVKRILAFTFLLVVFNAYKYYKSFTSDVRFDNVYITPYFRKIDARRRAKGKSTLLPLKKIEASHYIVVTSPRMVKSERKKLGKGTLLLVFRGICAWMIFFADNILYTVMDIIRKHSKVDYKQTGFNHINVTVVGTGFMSNIVRLFIKGLDTKHELKQLTSNLECLPNPVKLNNIYYHYVFGVYAVIWALIIVDAYALRLRKAVAAFFFRKREKQRVLHLYNTMLKSRKMFLKTTIRKLKKRAQKLKLGSRSGVLHALTKCLPCLCGWLRVFTAARGRCLVCNDVENKKFISCDDKDCNFIYCPDCWLNLKEKCYACMPLDDFSSTDTDATTDADDEDADDI